MKIPMKELNKMALNTIAIKDEPVKQIVSNSIVDTPKYIIYDYKI